MSRNTMITLIAVLAIVVVGLIGYMVYQQQQQPGLEIKVDGNGVQVTGNG
jgi:predicted negative regulator of RcsB-dependent stress response